MSLFPSPEHRKLLLTTLRMMGVKSILVEFSGGGDSGDIQQPYALNAQSTEVDLSAPIVWPKERSVLKNHVWSKISEEQTQPISDVLRNLTNEALENQHLDWYNNDGGQGHLEIDFSIDPPSIQLYVGINETVTHDHNFDYTDADLMEDA